MKRLFTATLSEKESQVFQGTAVEQLFESLAQQQSRILAVADTNTLRFVPEGVAYILVETGEEAKTLDTVSAILSRAKQLSFARDDMFVAVGGGVICDVTAFAASLYMRGARLALAPTTLLSQVDASLGGKTGVDFEGVKNLVGSFYPASMIFLSTETLQVLPDPEFKNGLGEVLKHALLSSDDELYQFLMTHHDQIIARDGEAIGKMIRLSLEVKRSFIERDPKETEGIREALNLGHTFAHGLETMGGLSRFSHGEAVAWGVVRALRLSTERNLCSPQFLDYGKKLFDLYQFDSEFCIDDVDAYLDAIANDKKKRGGLVRFVLLEGQGQPVLVPLDTWEVRALV
ncbi:MAG: 3-dehydroquinate synthase [Sphaerochaetaceae bacterium]|nr:3-dehydroquinate synthase [Sphaerochaetaceae bacterium]